LSTVLCVLVLSTILPETFLILKRIPLDFVMNAHTMSARKVQLILVIF
jgi:hypothetical protein